MLEEQVNKREVAIVQEEITKHSKDKEQDLDE